MTDDMKTHRLALAATSFALLASLTVACGNIPIPDLDPCAPTGTGGQGGTGGSAGSGTSTGTGGDPNLVVIDMDQGHQTDKWCPRSIYLWPDTYADLVNHGDPTFYCICMPGPASDCPHPSGKAYCNRLMRLDDNGEKVPFFPPHRNWAEGYPYVCLLDELTPAL